MFAAVAIQEPDDAQLANTESNRALLERFDIRIPLDQSVARRTSVPSRRDIA
jgi:hypothetical protein